MKPYAYTCTAYRTMSRPKREQSFLSLDMALTDRQLLLPDIFFVHCGSPGSDYLSPPPQSLPPAPRQRRSTPCSGVVLVGEPFYATRPSRCTGPPSPARHDGGDPVVPHSHLARRHTPRQRQEDHKGNCVFAKGRSREDLDGTGSEASPNHRSAHVSSDLILSVLLLALCR